MNRKIVIPIVAVIGLAVLFFFPEPQTHFLEYVATAVLFVIVIIILLWKMKG